MTNLSIDNRFDKVDARFDKIDKQMANIDKQLDKIVSVVVKGFDCVGKVLETKASATDLQKVMNTLDKLLKQQEISDDERLVMSVQLTRLHDWVEQAAKRIDLKFVR